MDQDKKEDSPAKEVKTKNFDLPAQPKTTPTDASEVQATSTAPKNAAIAGNVSSRLKPPNDGKPLNSTRLKFNHPASAKGRPSDHARDSILTDKGKKAYDSKAD